MPDFSVQNLSSTASSRQQLSHEVESVASALKSHTQQCSVVSEHLQIGLVGWLNFKVQLPRRTAQSHTRPTTPCNMAAPLPATTAPHKKHS
eukprot:jgi/Chrzof1/4052/Cz13g18170.t1